MDARTADKIEALTPEIKKLWTIEDEELKWLLPLLDPSIQTATEILTSCVDRPRTYEEIAEEIQRHPNTVKQYLSALKKGGFSLKQDSTNGWTTKKGGRHRKITRADS